MATTIAAATTTAAVTSALNIVVIYGSTRTGRFGLPLAQEVVKRFTTAGHTATLVDALEVKLPTLEKPFHHYKPEDTVPENLAKLATTMSAADSYVIVDGEYNYTPTPGLLNILDHFHHAQYKYKVSSLVTYGASFGGVRTAYVLRNTLSELGMIVTPTSVPTPNIWAAFGADGKLANEATSKNIDTLVNEHIWYVNAIKAAKAVGLPQVVA